jgi:hypothetical protein
MRYIHGLEGGDFFGEYCNLFDLLRHLLENFIYL